jgi:hypothetical protein
MIFFAAQQNAYAGDATLTWNPNSEPDLAGYIVYYGTASGQYGISINVGNQTNFVVTGLGLGTYFFAVTAYDTSGNESGYSNEVSKSISDTTPPGNVQNFTAQAGPGQITLNWINPPDADFAGVLIMYRTDHYPTDINDGTPLGNFTGSPNQTMSTTHKSLQGGLTYYYAASSYDSSGNYQHTSYASATASFSPNGPGNTGGSSASGGCGMVFPTDGRPSGPAQAADMIAVMGLPLLMLMKKIARTIWFKLFHYLKGLVISTFRPFCYKLSVSGLRKLMNNHV